MQHAPAVSLRVFDWMRQQPWCRPRLDSYSLAIQIAAHSRMWGRSEALFEEMQADGVRPDSFVFSAMVHVLAQQGRWEDAIGLVERRAAADGLAARHGMLATTPPPSQQPSSPHSPPSPPPPLPPPPPPPRQTPFLSTTSHTGDVAGIRAAVAESLALGLPEPESFRMALVLGFARAGEMDRAWIVFVGKEESERVSEGVSEGVQEGVASQVSQKQPKRGVEPSLYVMVVEAMVGAGRMEQAEAVCAEYGRAHLVTVQRFKYGRPYTVLLSAYLLAGNLLAFSRVWTAMRAGGRPADSYALRLLAKACASMGGLRGLAVLLWAAKEEREREVGGSEGESEGGSEEVDSPTWEAVGASGGASVAVPEGSVTDEPCASSAAVAAGASAAAPLAELAAGAMVVEVPPEEVEAAERQFPVLAGELRGSDKALRVVVRYLFKDADVAGGDDIVPADVAAGDDVVPADVAASGEKVDGGMAEGDGHGVVEAGSGWLEECVGVPAAAEEAVSVPAAGQQHVCGGRGKEASEGDHAGESDWDVLGQSVCASDGMVEGVEGAEAVFKSTQKQTRGVLGQSVCASDGMVEGVEGAEEAQREEEERGQGGDAGEEREGEEGGAAEAKGEVEGGLRGRGGQEREERIALGAQVVEVRGGAGEVVEGVGMAVEGVGMPVEGVGMAVEGVGMAVEGVGMPVEGVGMPVEGVGMPVEGVGMPVEGVGMAVEGVGMPVEGVGMAVEGVGMPVAGVGMPVEGVGMPVEGVGMPVEGVGMPVEGVGMPVEGVGMPVATTAGDGTGAAAVVVAEGAGEGAADDVAVASAVVAAAEVDRERREMERTGGEGEGSGVRNGGENGGLSSGENGSNSGSSSSSLSLAERRLAMGWVGGRRGEGRGGGGGRGKSVDESMLRRPVVGGKVEAGTVQHGGSWRDENQLGAVHMAVAEMAVAEAAVAEMAVAEMAVAEMAVAEMAVAEAAVAEAAVAETAVAETAVAETAVAETAVAEMAVAERAVEAAVAEASPEGDFPEEMVAQAAGGEAEAVDDAITKVIAAEAGGNEAAAAAGSDAAPEEMVAKAVGGVAEVVDGSTWKVTAEEPVGNEVAGADSHAVEGEADRVGNRVGDRLGQRFGNRFGRDRFGDRVGNDRVGDYVQSTYWGVVWNPESGAEGGDARAGGTGRWGGRVGGRVRARVGERVRSALEELERAEEGELAERWAQLAQGEGERAGERGGERGGARGRRQGAAKRVEQTWELMGERRARLRGDRERLSPVMGGGRGVRGEGNEGADEAGMGEWEQEVERDGEGRGSEVVWKRVDPEEAWLLVQQQMVSAVRFEAPQRFFKRVADPVAPPPPPAAWARVFSALRDPGQYGQLKEVYRMMLSAVGREGTQIHGQQGQEGQEEGQMRRQQGQEGHEGQEESQMPVQERQEELRWVQQGREEMQVGRSMSRYAGTADGGVDSKRSETQEGDNRGRGSGRVDSSGSDSNEGDSNESATVFTGGYVLPFNLVLMSACRQEAADDVAAVFGDMLSHNVIPSWRSLLFVLKGACGPNQPFPSPATLVAFVASKATQLPPEPHVSVEPCTSDRVTSAAAPCASSASSAHASLALSTRAREVLENMAVLLIGEPWAVDRLRWSVEIAECMQRAQGSSPLLLPSPLARRFFFASRSLRLVGKERDEEGRGEAEKRDEGRGREEVEEMEYVGKGREQGGGEKGSEGRGGVEGEQDEEAEEGLDGRGVGLGASERRELLKQQLIGVVRPDERREEEKWEGGSVAVLGSAEAREELADRMEALLEASAAARQAAWEEKTARRAAEQAEWAAKQLRVEAEWREERERERGVAVERWVRGKGRVKSVNEAWTQVVERERGVEEAVEGERERGIVAGEGGGEGGFGGDEEGRVRGMVRGGLGEGPEEGRWGAETRGDRVEEEGAAGKGVAVGATGVGATDLGEQEQGVGEQREQRRQREEREEREAFAVGVAEQVRMLECAVAQGILPDPTSCAALLSALRLASTHHPQHQAPSVTSPRPPPPPPPPSSTPTPHSPPTPAPTTSFPIPQNASPQESTTPRLPTARAMLRRLATAGAALSAAAFNEAIREAIGDSEGKDEGNESETTLAAAASSASVSGGAARAAAMVEEVDGLLLEMHRRGELPNQAASLLHCLSHASIPVPGGALLDVLRAAAAHGQADFFVFLLREWVAADVTVLGGPRALEEAVPWFQRCLGAHPHAPLSPALAVSWFRRCLGAHPHGTPSPAVVQVLLHSAVSWFRRCLGAYPHAPPSPAVVRALLHVLQRKSMWHEMLDVFGSLQHYPGYHDKTGSMWHEMLDVFGSLQHCPGYHDKHAEGAWGMWHEMLDAFRRMRDDPGFHNKVNYTTLIRTLRRDVNYTTLIRTLLHCRQPKLPLTLFPNMCPISSALPYASQVNYTTVIRTLLHCRQPKLALTLFRDMLTSGLLQCDTHGRVLSARDNATTHERLLQAVRHAAHLVGDREVLSMVGGGAVGARSTSRSGRFRPAPSAVKDAVRHVALLVGDREVLGMVGGGAVAARSTSRSGRFRPAPSAVLGMAVRHAALLVGGREVLGMVGGATDAGSKSRSERIRPALPGLWRPQLNPSNVVRQMQEAGRADAAPVVVMALMEEREVRRALAERTAWDRRTKRAVMRMAAVARVCKVREEGEGGFGRECKIRFEAIDLSDIAGETDGSKKTGD
ncbi:unnamed protein product [Closterium sp. NIES-64]|nr:unnamed protein product [Closterium sp. NIES-64]